MPKGKWIDKKTAQHFTLVHRPQNDPLIHDNDAPSMILNPTELPNASKVKKLDDMASELGTSEVQHMRANEGEAASYGVYYDDSEYDYMQHLRDLDGTGGASGGDVVFVEAKATMNDRDKKGKGKQKQSLEDALRDLDVADKERKKAELFDEDMLPSKNLQHVTYQAQQDVPDAIAGFQPDMDPRLREVLEALEDEAYVEDDDDIFKELAKDGHELDDIEFEGEGVWEDEDDAGWESDDTAKPKKEYRDPRPVAGADDSEAPELVPVVGDADAGEEADVVKNDNWLEDFKKFKQKQKAGGGARAPAGAASQSDLQSSLMTSTTNGGRRKKRKGAQTSQSGYSMTSSSLVRTEQLGILDARFEKLASQYEADEDEDDFPLDNDDTMSAAGASRMSTTSSVQGATRGDFGGILDDFLDGYSMYGKKQVKKGKARSGTDELDEMRRELGPARIKGRSGAGFAGKKAATASR
ncbi:Low temperature viability protein [Xylariomycetidae sp. FL0641]|nr:Low temperature viability protein [Xylariomycetidae sp. FL0641]